MRFSHAALDQADRASRLHGRLRAGADRRRRRRRAERGAGRAQCHAGLFAESRPADPDRGRFARDARQEKGSDLCRQCEGGAGRHHHDVEDARGVLRFGSPAPPAGAARPNAKAAKSAPMQSATPGPGGSSSIRRLEAKGNVVVTQKDQVVTGETAVFDTKANMITMLGGIVLTQGKNVLRGDRLMVDMTTGVSRVESDSGRVQGLFISSGGQGGPRRSRECRPPRRHRRRAPQTSRNKYGCAPQPQSLCPRLIRASRDLCPSSFVGRCACVRRRNLRAGLCVAYWDRCCARGDRRL